MAVSCPNTYFRTRLAEIRAEVDARPPRPAPEPSKAKDADQDGYVYFMKAGNVVKIGFTTNPRARLHSLQTGCADPAIIVKIVEGTRRKERYFHKRFEIYRLKGEWFDLRGMLAKYLERCISPVALPTPKQQPEIEIRL